MAKLTRQQFIEKIAPYAIKDMEKSKIPASLTIAQGILESSNGNSGLTTTANNLFGIKGSGTVGFVTMSTTEYVNGKPIIVNAKFRKYNNWEESINDHSQLFINGVSWNRSLYHNIIGKDGITASYEVAKAGYATDPKYAEKLIALINDNNLLQYDKPKVDEQTNNKPLESEKIKQLEETIRNILNELSKLNERLKEIPPPKWFTTEFPDAIQLLSNKTATIDFWRTYAITLRIMKENKLF